LLDDRSGRFVAQGRNSIKQSSAMPDHGDPKILQILGGQPRQHLGVDSIISERGGVLF